jgi:F0F1-type ATP synthase alpha subunit
MQNNNVIVRDILKKFKFYAEALDTGKIISVKDGVARVNGLFGVVSGEMVQFGSPKAPVGSDTQVGSLNRGTEKLIDQKPYIEQLKAGLVSRKIEIMFAAIAALILGCLYLVDTVPTVSPNITVVEEAREMGGMGESGESP